MEDSRRRSADQRVEARAQVPRREHGCRVPCPRLQRLGQRRPCERRIENARHERVIRTVGVEHFDGAAATAWRVIRSSTAIAPSAPSVQTRSDASPSMHRPLNGSGSSPMRSVFMKIASAASMKGRWNSHRLPIAECELHVRHGLRQPVEFDDVVPGGGSGDEDVIGHPIILSPAAPRTRRWG
ncbi:hypothetical protein GCM10023152_06500 [Agromyces bauzanensis]|uniref:Uncharacterized protein n=1 Tax=Agromyces bauzanensis TaxID=1308924 RepID=A0A917PJE9_9MICO|nr:hypothetical protein GCM10011372_18560 [Agromyces bauzanensis]